VGARPVQADACVDVTMRFHSLFECVVLIAVGVQAVTPDSRKLASFNLFRVLCCATEGALPVRNSNDEQDDVSGTVQSSQKRHRLALMWSITISDVELTRLTALTIARGASPLGSTRANVICRDGLTGLFYHMRC
jgi:hypothetical protein